MLFQLVERPTNFASHRARGTGFHLDEHRGCASVGNHAEGARNCEVRNSGRAP